MNKKAIVIMRTYNSENFIEKSLLSFSEQTYSNKQLIIYDDGSSDNTISKIKKIADEKSLNIVCLCSSENLGCAVAAQNLMAETIKLANDNDIIISLDSDDRFFNNDAIKNIVNRMNETQANLCITGFAHSGDLTKVLSDNNGTVHDGIVCKLGKLDKATTLDKMPELAYDIDTLGWTKSMTAGLAKNFNKLIPTFSKEINVCEDFVYAAIVGHKDVKITGVNIPTHEYNKRTGSVTSLPKKEDFTNTRLSLLKSTYDIVNNNLELFRPEALKGVKNFLENKHRIISNVIKIHQSNGYLSDYSTEEFTKDFNKIFEKTNAKKACFQKKQITPAMKIILCNQKYR